MGSFDRIVSSILFIQPCMKESPIKATHQNKRSNILIKVIHHSSPKYLNMQYNISLFIYTSPKAVCRRRLLVYNGPFIKFITSSFCFAEKIIKDGHYDEPLVRAVREAYTKCIETLLLLLADIINGRERGQKARK